MVALGFDDAATINRGLEAIRVEVLEVDIGYGFPVREEKFHGRSGNALDGLEVTHIGVCFVFDKLVEEHAVDVFCTESVHHLGEVFHIDGPALVNHIL